jgi:8-oxo-dGTP pyrophosphatase MutT (NUDIX family)
MSAPSRNPFERFGIDPKEGPRAITERLRELAQDANEEDRAAIREAWEELTLHPLRRLRAAVGAHPRHPDAARTSPDYAPLRGRKTSTQEPLTFADFAPRPSITHALAAFLSNAEKRTRRSTPQPLDDDPVLALPERPKNHVR